MTIKDWFTSEFDGFGFAILLLGALLIVGVTICTLVTILIGAGCR